MNNPRGSGSEFRVGPDSRPWLAPVVTAAGPAIPVKLRSIYRYTDNHTKYEL